MSQLPDTKIVIPTGFEKQKADIERRRRIADALIARGLQPQQNMTSFAEVAGSLANAFAGRRLDKKATEMEGALGETIRKTYQDKLADFYAKTRSGQMTPQEVIQTYGSDPLLEKEVDPYRDVLKTSMTEREKVVDFGGVRRRQADVMGQQAPSKITDPVIRRPDGTIGINPFMQQYNLVGQGYAPGTDFTPAAPMTQAQLVGGPDTMNVTGLTPEERAIMARQLQIRAGGGQPTYGAAPAPSAVIDGKPVWEINGKLYDNPEGR